MAVHNAARTIVKRTREASRFSEETTCDEIKDAADKPIDRGPADRLEDKADRGKDKAIRSGVKKAF